jgi:hypothetical protein
MRTLKFIANKLKIKIETKNLRHFKEEEKFLQKKKKKKKIKVNEA